ncbi:MAG: phage tail tape measure protein [Urechidicola sp.]|nr:phage tail tape measure protein [Urechidicola sp.]
MSATAKLRLILELGNKLFNNKLVQTQRKLRKSTDKMKGKLKSLKISSIDAFSAMRNEVPLFGRAMDLLGNPYVLLTAGLLAVVTLMGKATVEAKKFNHEFLQVQNLNLDKNNADLKTYKGLIRDTSFETGRGLVESTKAYYDIQSALGFYGKDAEKVFKQVAKFSTATGADLNDSINQTSKAIKAFGLDAKDTEMLLDSNAKTVQVGITTFKELAKVQTEYAGAAAGAGQEVDSANKLFAAFTSIAKDSRTAATMTKTAFMGLTQKTTLKGLKDIGVSVYDANGEVRDLGKILIDVDKQFKKLTPKQIDAVINKIGGPEGLRALLTKMKTGADDLFKTFYAFDASKFNLNDALKNAHADATVLGQMVKNRFNTIMARLGEKIMPLVVKVLNKVNIVLTWIYDNFELLEDIVESVAFGFGVLGARLLYFQGMALLSTFASVGLSGALGMVTLGLHAIKTAIFSIPIVGWILLAVSAVVLLYKRFDKFRAVINGLGAVLKAFFVNMWEGFKDVLGSIIDGLGAVGKMLKGLWDMDWDKVKEGASEFGDAVKRGVGGAIDMNPLGSAIKNGKEYGKAFKGAYDKEMDKSAAAKNKKEKEKNLLDPNNTDEEITTTNTNTGGDINKVSSAGSAPKTIIIEKITFNEGGINTTNTVLNNMSKEEIEEWFNESMMRVIRNAEMS